jgi:hypothetical protein
MRLHRTPGVKPLLEGREVVVFSPHLNDRDFHVSFAAEYRLFTSWPSLSAHLQAKHPGAVSVGVFPTAPLQILS